MGLTLEVCVESVAGLAAAVEGGADRVELCSALGLGGLTPSVGFMAIAARCGVPVLAMIRPRAGDFVWSEAELGVMEADIAAARDSGLAGVVLGASLPDGRLDRAALARLVRAAEAGGHRFLQRHRTGAFEGSDPEFSKIPVAMDLTLHRCLDLVPDIGAALDEAMALGFRRVLTSGGAVTALAGAARIEALVRQAAGRIAVMAGAGVTPETAPGLLATGVQEMHASCSESVVVRGRITELGFAPADGRRTSAARVRALKQAMEDWGGVQRHL